MLSGRIRQLAAIFNVDTHVTIGLLRSSSLAVFAAALPRRAAAAARLLSFACGYVTGKSGMVHFQCHFLTKSIDYALNKPGADAINLQFRRKEGRGRTRLLGKVSETPPSPSAMYSR